MVGCSSSWLLVVLQWPPVAADPLACAMCCVLLLLLRRLWPRTAAAPDKSRLSSSVARSLTPAWFENEEPMSELMLAGRASAAANALPVEAPPAELRNLLLLVPLPPVLGRALARSLAPA